MNAGKSVLYEKSKIKILFLVAIALISLFFSNQEIKHLHYVGISKIIIYIPVFLLSIILLMFNKKMYLDLISVFLFSRLAVYIIPLIYTENLEGYMGNYFAVIASFVAYFVASQNHYNFSKYITQKISRVLAFYLFVGSLQVVYLFFMLRNQYGDININLLKYYMLTPIGKSNYIAAILLPLIVFIYNSEFNKRFKIILISLGILSLYVIKSKNAFFVLIILLIIKFIKSYISQIKKELHYHNYKVPIIIITIVLLIIATSISISLFRYFLIKWNMGMTYNSGSLYDIINALTSNRLNVYANELSRWSEHLLLGNGLAYDPGYLRSHNWIIELLAQSGVIGLITFFGAIILWHTKVYKYRNSNKFMKAIYYLIITILFQGLAEVSLFTTSIDILFWYSIGASIAEVNCLKYKTLENNITDLAESSLKCKVC